MNRRALASILVGLLCPVSYCFDRVAAISSALEYTYVDWVGDWDDVYNSGYPQGTASKCSPSDYGLTADERDCLVLYYGLETRNYGVPYSLSNEGEISEFKNRAGGRFKNE